jgi:hypothetical protein
MNKRVKMPARRRLETIDLAVGGHLVAISIGIYPKGHDRAGQPGEIFLELEKARGGELDTLLSDAAIMVSLLLQCDFPPPALADLVGRTTKIFPGGKRIEGAAASILGAALDELVNFKSEVEI